MRWIKLNYQPGKVIVDARATMRNMVPLAASYFTIQHIIKNYPPPYTLMLSGGIDSQAMLYSWLISGEKFQTRVVRYNDGLNDFDLVEIAEFAKQHKVELTYFDFDLLNFLDCEYDKWANKYKCTSPQICTHMKICEDLPGTAIFSGNFAAPGKLFVDDAIMGIYRYSLDKPVVPFFFLETPELAYSLLPTIKHLNYGDEGFNDKTYAYHLAGFPVIGQPAKQTGFEKVKDLYDSTHKHLVTIRMRLEFANKPSRRVFDLLLRYPYEKKFGKPTYKFLMNPI